MIHTGLLRGGHKNTFLSSNIMNNDDKASFMDKMSNSGFWQSQHKGSRQNSEMPRIELFGSDNPVIPKSDFMDSEIQDKGDWLVKLRKNKLFWIELLRNEKKRLKRDQKAMSKGKFADFTVL